MYYYDREGKPLSEDEGMSLFSVNADDRRVAETTVGDVYISTVYLGIDHNWSNTGPPLIYETMAFRTVDGGPDFGEELYCYRYATEEQAQIGHDFVVKCFLEGRDPYALLEP